MKIIVLIKEVPDMTSVKFDSEKGVVDRGGAPAEINPFDENALQAAIDLKKNYGDVEITVLTMGPPRAEKSLKMAYAKGADKLVLATDRAFGGSDTYATAKVLSETIKLIGDYDLIICGEKSVDGDTAQVGAEVAEFLNIPHSYYVDNIELNYNNSDSVKVNIENLSGKRQVRLMNTPCLVSVTKNIARPLLPTLDRMLESLNHSAEVIELSDLTNLNNEDTGFKGSPTKVSKIVVPKEPEKKNLIYRGSPDEFIDNIEAAFKEKGIL